MLFVYSVNRQRMKLKPGPGGGREFRAVAPNQTRPGIGLGRRRLLNTETMI